MPKRDIDTSVVKKANIELYRKYAKKYEILESSLFTKENQRRIKKIIEELSKGRKSGKFLDVGCGTGNVLKFAEPLFSKTYGIDISMEMLKLSKSKKSTLIRGDVSHLPFRSNEFDVLTCYSLLHHVKDVGKLIKECHRVLKKGGTVYTDNDPNIFFQRTFWWWRLLRFSKTKEKFRKMFGEDFYDIYKSAEYHRNFGGINPFDLEKKFKDAGFSKVEIVFRFHPKPDRFTKMLKLISKVCDRPNLYDNFMIFATK